MVQAVEILAVLSLILAGAASVMVFRTNGTIVDEVLRGNIREWRTAHVSFLTLSTGFLVLSGAACVIWSWISYF